MVTSCTLSVGLPDELGMTGSSGRGVTPRLPRPRGSLEGEREEPGLSCGQCKRHGPEQGRGATSSW
jgi:hypothetical protein